MDAEALDAVATEQHGVVSRQQLRDLGLSDTMIARWLEIGRLHHLHRQVFAIGHTAITIEGRLWAALLYAGEGAVLSHTTAAWAWQLIDAEPTRIHITVPGRRSSLPDVRVHHSRKVDRATCRDLPVTSVARTLVDIAAMLPYRQIRRALAEAEYRNLLEPAEVLAVTRPGRRGSRALRLALAHHLPELAETLSILEERFLELCQVAGLPLPTVNAKIGGMRVDALWREQRLVAELDGAPAHGGWAQASRDRERELALRSLGFRVVRYTWKQITERAAEVAADLRRLLGQ
jgi:predicted transcriptional regulator of viral defense system